MTFRKTRFAALAGSLALLATACGREELPQNTLDPQGPVARKLDDLVDPVFVIAGFFFVLVNVLVLFVVVKFRRRSDDDSPKQVHGHALLELGWTAGPAVILAVVGILTLGVIFDIDRRPAAAESLQVKVTGHQFWWEYEYQQHGITTANELHIPVGRKVALDLESVDVIHSFWPPKLAGLLDVVPGRTNHMVVEADKPGVYHGQCAEFCGMSHANMYLKVVAHTPADFDAWVQANTTAPRDVSTLTGDAAAGASLFRAKGCASCHTVQGYAAGEFGPDLTHLQQRDTFAGSMFELDERNLRRWLRDPPGEKPGAKMPNLELTEDEITKLIAYLDTLK
ncbi:MAG: cytochrome c oxidase subunit II [Actinomycetota bacterium]|nr:cytochrome c oxidase subunit II [Actinomycetota bacterium]